MNKLINKIGTRNFKNVFFLIFTTMFWLLVGLQSLQQIPQNWWQHKDDGVITLSHSLNYVIYGLVGASPSGPVVEGFSSPLQFIISGVFFKIIAENYKFYLDAFVITNYLFHSIYLGLIFLKLSRLFVRDNLQYMVATLSHFSFGLIIVNFWSYFAWSISGLENPLIVTILLILTNSLFKLGSNVIRTNNILTLLIILLALVRIEFSLIVIILIIVIANTRVNKKFITIFYPLIFKVIIFLLIFHTLRLTYFGNIYPSTALAQNKSFTLFNIIVLSLFILDTYFTFESPRIEYKVSKKVRIKIYVIITSLVLILILINSESRISIVLGVIYLLFKIILKIKTSHFKELYILFGIVFFFIAQFVIFGPARLDPIRVVVNIFPFILLSIYITIFLIADKLNRLRTFSLNRQNVVTASSVLMITFLTVTSILILSRFNKPFDLPWSISPSESKILHVASEILKPMQTDEIILSVANPDLGKLSFSKQVNVIDLGYIGSPIVKKLTLDGADKLLLYLNNIARPDIVQLHGGWSCLYSEWINSNEFKQSYYPVITPPSRVKELTNTKCAFNSEYMIWVRNDLSKELNLSREFLESQNILKLIEEEVDKCVLESDIIFRCEYLARSLFRIRPFLVENYDLQELTKALSTSPTYLIDSALLLNKRNLDTLVMQELDSINTK